MYTKSTGVIIKLHLFDWTAAFKDINDLEGHGARYEYDSVSKRGYAVVFKLDEDELMESDIAFDEPENQLHQNQRAKNVTSAQSREVRYAVVLRALPTRNFDKLCNHPKPTGYDD